MLCNCGAVRVPVPRRSLGFFPDLLRSDPLMAKKIKPANDTDLGAHQVALYVGWILLAAAWLMVTAALVSYNQFDPPSHMSAPHNDPPLNWIGHVVGTRRELARYPGVALRISMLGSPSSVSTSASSNWMSPQAIDASG